MVWKFTSSRDDQWTYFTFIEIYGDDARFFSSVVCRNVFIDFIDRLSLRIPWDIPTSDEEIPRLTHIYRNQHFLVWLAAMDLESKVIRRVVSSLIEYRRDVSFRIFTFFVQSNGRKSLK